jgi:transcriptional regulator with XRE-family HTH domain
MPITREVRTEPRLADPGRYDLTALTAAERLFVWRHRQKTRSGRLLGRAGSAMSQAEAAAELGVSRGLYGKLENGLRSSLSAEEVESLATALEPLNPTLGELCFLARRRSGELLTALEKEVGVSRPQFHELERAGAAVILRLWMFRGYRFPHEMLLDEGSALESCSV